MPDEAGAAERTYTRPLSPMSSKRKTRKAKPTPDSGRPTAKLAMDPRTPMIERLRWRALAIEVVVLSLFLSMERFYDVSSVARDATGRGLVFYSLFSGAMYLASGTLILSAFSRNRPPATALRIMRVRIILDTALLLSCVVFWGSLSDTSVRMAEWLIPRFPILRGAGVWLVTKAIDWTMGALVSVPVTAWFTSRYKRISALSDDHEQEPVREPRHVVKGRASAAASRRH